MVSSTSTALSCADNVMVSQDFIVILGTDGEDWRRAPQDQRFRSHAMNGQKSEKLFRAANIEKFIKSAESLRAESTLTKIWTEFDKISIKKANSTIEKVHISNVQAFRHSKF